MIPLSDQSETTRMPIMNRLLVVANIVVWLYTLSLLASDRAAAEAFYQRYSFDWDAFRGSLASGAFSTDAMVPLFTHMFLHGGWLHLISNLLFLWVFGDNVEDRLGAIPYLGFYLACGVFAAVGQGLIAPAPMVGASGAIAGVLGAYIVLSPGARVRTLVFLGFFITVVQLPAIVVIGLWVVYQVIEGAALRLGGVHPATENVAIFAHLAGFVAGVALLLVLRPRRRGLRLRG